MVVRLVDSTADETAAYSVEYLVEQTAV